MNERTAIVPTAALALLVAACGGGGSSTGSGSPNRGGASAVAFSACMRSHGVPKYPDASSSNELPNGLPKVIPQALGVSDSQFLAAANACRRFSPNGSQPSQIENQQLLSKLVKFAQCMRSHGVSNWPDPERVSAVGRAADPGGSPYEFDLQGVQRLEGRSFSPQVATAMRECLHREHLTDVAWT
jgi:hypothetical protein